MIRNSQYNAVNAKQSISTISTCYLKNYKTLRTISIRSGMRPEFGLRELSNCGVRLVSSRLVPLIYVQFQPYNLVHCSTNVRQSLCWVRSNHQPVIRFRVLRVIKL